MQTTPLTYAAELEQAATAAEVLDQASQPGAPWGFDAMTAAVARFGHAGEDLPFEYQNDLYELELGYPAAYVLFH
jgi:hypothetical protein